MADAVSIALDKSEKIIPSLFEGVNTIFESIHESPTSQFVSVVGILLLIISLFFVYKFVSTNTTELPNSYKYLLFMSLITAFVFCVAGPALSLVEQYYSNQRQIGELNAQIVALRARNPPPAPSETAVRNLEENAKTEWLIRLITYSRGTNLLSKLARLGPEKQQYTFVASYDELRGHKVSEAVAMVGGTVSPGQRVIAIIFRRPNMLYPANARGLLQVIKAIDQNEPTSLIVGVGNSSDPGAASPASLAKSDNLDSSPRFDVLKQLNPDEKTDINQLKDIKSWSWRAYGPRYYLHYCRMAQSFRCESQIAYAEKQKMGDLTDDWHPLGFSERLPIGRNPCEDPFKQCTESHEWETAINPVRSSFGARAFLVRNLALDDIDDRYLIDFPQPSQQSIPNLEFPP